MFDNRLVRGVWAANGFLLACVLIALLAQLAVQYGEPVVERMLREEPPERGMIVGDAANVARELRVNPQHLEYDTPTRVGDSPYFYAPVYVIDRELPDEVKDAIESAGDISRSLLGARINVLFFREDGSEVRRLIPRNGYVDQIRLPTSHNYRDDSKPPYLLYQIAMEDTNGDNRVDGEDDRAYYTSDLSGGNFRQITPDSLDLDGHWISQDFQTIFFEEVVDQEEQNVDGYRYTLQDRRTYTYDVRRGEFRPFDELHDAFAEIERAFVRRGDTTQVQP